MPEESPVRVLERACQVLDCFTTDTPRLRIADLRRLTLLPPTTIARIVKTLMAQELIEKDGDDYRLGLRVLVWTAPATAGSDLIAAAGPVVDQIRDLTHETAGLYVRHGTTRVTVAAALSTYSVVYRTDVGQVRPLQAGAAGKVFMAHDPAALDAALAKGLTPYTPHTVTDTDLLVDQLEGVRRQGWAFAEEEVEVGLNSIAAPVFGPTRAIVGSLAVGGPSFRLSASSAQEFGPLIAATAQALSQRLGYTGHLVGGNQTAAERK